jgi:peptide/nickel transport system substrate-binding protein
VLDSVVHLTQSRHYRATWRNYRYDPARAQRLLEQASCRRGADRIYVCDGKRLSLRLVTTGLSGGYRARLLDLIPAHLRRVGIEVVPLFATGAALFGQIIPSGDFDLVIFGSSSGPDPDAKPIFGCGGVANVTGYCQLLVTRELDQAERIFDADKQARVLHGADAQLARDVPVIPLFQMPQSAARKAFVRNFGLSLNAQLNLFWNAENWWRDR